MIVYVESSVLLRFLLHQPHVLKEWGQWSQAYTSQLTKVEGLRTLDRLRLEAQMTDEEVSHTVQDLSSILDQIDEIELTPSVLEQASQAYPTIIRTLDAIHLSSALLWQKQTRQKMIFLTHDGQLGRAALAVGMQTKGF